MPDDEVQPWLSVITVVKDDPRGFALTMQSLMGQELAGVEHVVIDSSTDASQVPVLLDSTDPADARYCWIPPSGVYPAMNAGLANASGTFVLFLNAGDAFLPDAIRAIRAVVDRDQPIWGYGQVTFVDPAGTRVTPQPFNYHREKSTAFARGRFPPHQGTFAQRSALTRIGAFNTNLQVAADYEAFLKLSRMADPAQTNAIIAEFHLGGLSSQRRLLSVREFHRARRGVLTMTPSQRAIEFSNTCMQAATLSAGQLVRRLREVRAHG